MVCRFDSCHPQNGLNSGFVHCFSFFKILLKNAIFHFSILFSILLCQTFHILPFLVAHDFAGLPELYRPIASKVHIEVPVIIAIYTGLRREEILGLRWQDIDFDNRILHIKNTCTKVGTKIVYAEKTKTKLSRRTVPMVDELYDYLLLQQYIQQKNREFFGDGYIDTDLVCVWKDGKPIKPDNLSKRFNRFLKENNLRIIRFHDIRHSFGSVIFNITGDIKVVSDLLGHSNISTTSNIYVKTNEKHKKEAVNYLENGNK